MDDLTQVGELLLKEIESKSVKEGVSASRLYLSFLVNIGMAILSSLERSCLMEEPIASDLKSFQNLVVLLCGDFARGYLRKDYQDCE